MSVAELSLLISSVSLFFAFWSAVVATYLALLRIREFRYEKTRQVRISAKAVPPFSGVSIEVTNLGKRPFTFRGIKVVYGTSPEHGTEFGRVSGDFPKRLGEDELFTATVPRSELMTASATRGSLQVRYSSVWVVVTVISGELIVERVYIDEAVIGREVPTRARPYIAADVFVGFPEWKPLGPDFGPLTNK